MVYRKGELSPSMLDIGWPHQVALPATKVQGKANGEAIEDFCKGLSKAPRGHSVCHEDNWWVVFCFADVEHAERFRVQFDGVKFNPKDRGRGSNWASWKRPASSA